jgi:hypothetical protein
MATRAETLPFVATSEKAERIPWFIWTSIIGVTSAIIGGHWDISWHRSIGRDDFWTPAHIAIYLCGVMAGLSCAYLILATTFGKSLYPKEATVKMWGFRGPVGAFLTAWGGVAMLTSAPFDDWWHNAYGLDVKIFSPPHVLLIIGVLAIQTGALLLMLGYMNRAEGALRRTYNLLFLYTGGMIVLTMSIMILEFTNRIYMHSGVFYRTVSLAIPLVLMALARASSLPWAATAVAGVYTAFMLGFQWILPLFPATPKLGPVLNPVTYFVPPQFPMLYLIPALAMDLIRPSVERRAKWVQAAVGGLVFFTVFVAVQWPFADFLMSPAAKNWFFGAHHQDYLTGPNSAIQRGLFIGEKTFRSFAQNIGLAIVYAVVASRLGLAWGDWMRKVRR